VKLNVFIHWYERGFSHRWCSKHCECKIGYVFSNLEEVVVVGYGTQKKKRPYSSISSIKGAAIQNLVTQVLKVNSPVELLEFKTSATGIQEKLQSQNSVSGFLSGTDPLYIVDGVPIYSGNNGSYTNSNALGDTPWDIESFEILKMVLQLQFTVCAPPMV
jgi:hypothetical protein